MDVKTDKMIRTVCAACYLPAGRRVLIRSDRDEKGESYHSISIDLDFLLSQSISIVD